MRNCLVGLGFIYGGRRRPRGQAYCTGPFSQHHISLPLAPRLLHLPILYPSIHPREATLLIRHTCVYLGKKRTCCVRITRCPSFSRRPCGKNVKCRGLCVCVRGREPVTHSLAVRDSKDTVFRMSVSCSEVVRDVCSEDGKLFYKNLGKYENTLSSVLNCSFTFVSYASLCLTTSHHFLSFPILYDVPCAARRTVRPRASKPLPSWEAGREWSSRARALTARSWRRRRVRDDAEGGERKPP